MALGIMGAFGAMGGAAGIVGAITDAFMGFELWNLVTVGPIPGGVWWVRNPFEIGSTRTVVPGVIGGIGDFFKTFSFSSKRPQKRSQNANLGSV